MNKESMEPDYYVIVEMNNGNTYVYSFYELINARKVVKENEQCEVVKKVILTRLFKL